MEDALKGESKSGQAVSAIVVILVLMEDALKGKSGQTI